MATMWSTHQPVRKNAQVPKSMVSRTSSVMQKSALSLHFMISIAQDQYFKHFIGMIYA
jgi:hypothetical protein